MDRYLKHWAVAMAALVLGALVLPQNEVNPRVTCRLTGHEDTFERVDAGSLPRALRGGTAVFPGGKATYRDLDLRHSQPVRPHFAVESSIGDQAGNSDGPLPQHDGRARTH